MRNTEDVSLGDRLSDVSEGLLCKGKRESRIYRFFAKELLQNNRQLITAGLTNIQNKLKVTKRQKGWGEGGGLN